MPFFGPLLRAPYPWFLFMSTSSCHAKISGVFLLCFFFLKLRTHRKCLEHYSRGFGFHWNGKRYSSRTLSWRMAEIMMEIQPMQVRVLCKSLCHEALIVGQQPVNSWRKEIVLPALKPQCWASCLTWMAQSIYQNKFQQDKCR